MAVTYKTAFSDHIAPKVPTRGSKGGEYDRERHLDAPQRDTSPDGVPELHRDTAVTDKAPSHKGPISRTPFKDAVG